MNNEFHNSSPKPHRVIISESSPPQQDDSLGEDLSHRSHRIHSLSDRSVSVPTINESLPTTVTEYENHSKRYRKNSGLDSLLHRQSGVVTFGKSESGTIEPRSASLGRTFVFERPPRYMKNACTQRHSSYHKTAPNFGEEVASRNGRSKKSCVGYREADGSWRGIPTRHVEGAGDSDVGTMSENSSNEDIYESGRHQDDYGFAVRNEKSNSESRAASYFPKFPQTNQSFRGTKAVCPKISSPNATTSGPSTLHQNSSIDGTSDHNTCDDVAQSKSCRPSLTTLPLGCPILLFDDADSPFSDDVAGWFTRGLSQSHQTISRVPLPLIHQETDTEVHYLTFSWVIRDFPMFRDHAYMAGILISILS